MSEAIKISEMDFNSESDNDLLTWISLCEEYKEEAHQAWGVFYNRYVKFLGSHCIRRYGRQLGTHGADDLVSDTFLHLCKKGARKFKTKETETEKLRHHVEAWLATIAYRLFLMKLRKQKYRPEEVQVEDIESFEAPKEPSLEDSESPQTSMTSMSPEREEQYERIKPILEELSDRERDILLTRFTNDYRSGGKQQFHPDDLERLANTWEITKDYVRQIYHRIMKKVKEQLS